MNRFNRGIARVKLELQENGNSDPVFDYDKMGVFGVTVYGTFHGDVEAEKTSEKTSEKILLLAQKNAYITIQELSESIGVTSRSIERNIENLKKQGKIERVGSDKGGYWKTKK